MLGRPRISATPPAACDTCWPTRRRVLVPTSNSSSTWPWRQRTGDRTAASGNRRRRHIVVAVALRSVEPDLVGAALAGQRVTGRPAGQVEFVGEAVSFTFDFPAPGRRRPAGPHPPRGAHPPPGAGIGARDRRSGRARHLSTPLVKRDQARFPAK